MDALATSPSDTTVLVLGGLLVLGAFLAGLAHRSFLSLTAVFVVAGFVLGRGGADVLHFDPLSGFVSGLATVALIVILFRDGLEVEAEMLQRAWHPPLRALTVAMPLTFLLVAAFAKLVTDLVLGGVAAYLLPRGRALGHEISPRQKSLYGLGAAFGTYGVAVATPHGNGFIAVFVAAIVLGMLRPDIRECFESRSEDLIELVKLGIFVVFGALLSFSDLFNDGWGAVAIVAATFLLIRPLTIFLSLMGIRLSWQMKAFMGWFGPKGVATMAF